jgi:hypothetical protein
MLKSKYYYIVAPLLALIVALNTGCEKLIEIDEPVNQVTTGSVFASDKLAAAARSGMFSSLASTPTQNQTLTIASSLQADDLLYLANVLTQQEYNGNTYTTVSSGQSSIFAEWYANIYRANAIIEGLAASTGTSVQVRRQYSAEARFIRAYCYFNLVNTFGDVPLVLATDPTVTAFLPRETTSNIYTQIIADLELAKTDLLADYAATTNDRVGVNRFTAAALLARVYLFTGNYTLAESNASEVIASPQYSLIPANRLRTDLFVRNSSESIWQLTPPGNAVNQSTSEAAAFLPSNPASQTTFSYRLDPRFTALFEPTDLRRQGLMIDYTFSGETFSVPFKYKYRTQALAVAAGVAEYQVIMRLAEQYLIRAEARARTGNNLSGALTDLRAIQSRAGATQSTSTSATALLTDIALENRKELFCEQAFRWNNLKRTGQADAVLTALKSTYRPAAKLLPIPQGARDANPNLTQNPGYQ